MCTFKTQLSKIPGKEYTVSEVHAYISQDSWSFSHLLKYADDFDNSYYNKE